MKKRSQLKYLLIFLCTCVTFIHAQNPPLNYLQNKSVTWDECIMFYRQLDLKYKNASLLEAGTTDIGKPLHIFVISSDSVSKIENIYSDQKSLLLINNGIHAGEPAGVDACLQLTAELLNKKDLNQLLKNFTLCIIPFYNIDGALNRSCCSRANQNGPEEYGFRANNRNLDLNRDFIKAEAANTRSLINIFQILKPEILVDTHISDGADYPYTMTLITSHKSKMNPILSNYTDKVLEPFIYEAMKSRNDEICPYVETIKEIPDSGLIAFFESPRFLTGYANLFNCIGFVSESHMLKPYAAQVKSTLFILEEFVNFTYQHSSEIKQIKKNADSETLKQKYFTLNWKADTTQFKFISFKGYEAVYQNSEISELPVLSYNREKEWKKNIKYYNHYYAADSVLMPNYYLIPQAWKEIKDRLLLNKIEFSELKADTLVEVNAYYIVDFDSPSRPYEGHYFHHNCKTICKKIVKQFYKGDLLVKTNQIGRRFLAETLEPSASDSYFKWNFFDAVLQQKEWFSSYVYEKRAMELVKSNPKLLEDAREYVKKSGQEKNSYAWLEYIYKHDPNYEKTAFQYPVFSIEYKK